MWKNKTCHRRINQVHGFRQSIQRERPVVNFFVFSIIFSTIAKLASFPEAVSPVLFHPVQRLIRFFHGGLEIVFTNRVTHGDCK